MSSVTAEKRANFPITSLFLSVLGIPLAAGVVLFAASYMGVL